MKTKDLQSQNVEKADTNPDPITGAPGSHPVGTGIGAVSGAVTGAAMGSIAGPVGAAVGGVIGALAGGLAGKEVAESFDPTVETAYWRDNYHTEPYIEPGFTYDDYRPAYLLGGERHAPGRPFEEAEKEMGEGWEEVKGESRLPWDKAREAARAGWRRRELPLPERNVPGDNG